MEDWDLNTEWESEEEEKPKEEKIKNKSTRRKTEVLELSEKYLYRRAFSELSLINLDINITKGKSYAFITGGDVDALSFLQLILRDIKQLDHLIISTWCANAEDCFYLIEKCKDKTI